MYLFCNSDVSPNSNYCQVIWLYCKEEISTLGWAQFSQLANWSPTKIIRTLLQTLVAHILFTSLELHMWPGPIPNFWTKSMGAWEFRQRTQWCNFIGLFQVGRMRSYNWLPRLRSGHTFTSPPIVGREELIFLLLEFYPDRKQFLIVQFVMKMEEKTLALNNILEIIYKYTSIWSVQSCTIWCLIRENIFGK